MLRYEVLKNRPDALRALTGLSREEFEDLYERFSPAWEGAEQKRSWLGKVVYDQWFNKKYSDPSGLVN